ncbi:Fe-S-containing hydro-lyase [Lactimicrobium massiliense]|uniref:Fe-S-containing hydro-lyase n=1 Tax=Lactimicrobium massiliense TaxID=2161814 RepID=UPI001AE80B5F|nr:Fe-S-containing hydro-lyase [Lactimicrobium massiliense]
MKEIHLPLTEEEIASLHAGDGVLLSGVIYTARDAAHKRMAQLIKEGKPLPFDLNGSVIYYVDPTPGDDRHLIGSAGPTTSSRMDVYTPKLLDLGLKATIGKGRRCEAVKEAIVRNKAIYFIAVGGAGALMSHCITSCETIAFDDLLSEAVRKLTVKDLPCFVGIDASGNDIYDTKGSQL